MEYYTRDEARISAGSWIATQFASMIVRHLLEALECELNGNHWVAQQFIALAWLSVDKVV